MLGKGKNGFVLIATVGMLCSIWSHPAPCTAQIVPDSLSTGNYYGNADDSFSGHLHHPLELLQGRIPGLLVSHPGSDPNGWYDIRLHGLATLLNDEQPLYVVDGVPGIPLSAIDPWDIVSFEVLRDGSAARWGLRGGSGVIHIRTRRADSGKPAIRFRSYIAAEQPGRSYDVLDATGFLIQQENIFGNYDRPSPEENSWIDVITRTALSTVSNLSVAGGSEAFAYRTSLSWRNVEGIALDTGYDRLNGRIHLRSILLEENLELGLHLAAGSNRSRIGFREAFEYAISFNPTAPLRTSDSQYGGYYQEALYNYYNPLAILEQNMHDGDDRLTTGTFTASYRFDPWLYGLSAHLLLSGTREALFRGEFYPDESYFRGDHSNGLARTEADDRTNRTAGFRFSWDGSVGGFLPINASVGYSVQNLYHEYEMKEAENLTNATSYSVIENTDINELDGEQDIVEEDHVLSAFYGTARIGDGHNWYIDMGLRYEGSSYLGRNNKWGAFPFVRAGYDLDHVLELSFSDALMIRAAYGVAGKLPANSGWSKAIYEPRGYYYSNGQYLPSYSQVQIENPDLKWESTVMWNAGLDFIAAERRFRSSIDLFWHESSDLIIDADLPIQPYPASSGYLNMGGTTNRGLEVAIQYDVIQREGITYTSGLNFSTIRTSYTSLSNEAYSMDGVMVGYPGAFCGCSTLFMRVREGEPVGQFYGPVFEGINGNGEWTFKQSDNGIAQQTIGNGLPTSFLGWSHSMGYRKWEIDVLFRGVFGHDLIPVARLAYGNQNMGRYNILKSSPENLEDLNTWSSYFVEDADYLKVDNLTISYRVSGGKSGILKRARFFASVGNLLTITGYSGIDPSARLSDYSPVAPSTGMLPWSGRRDVMAPGIDYAHTWLDSRTFVAGVELGF